MRDKARRMRDNLLWLLWFLRGAAACPPAAAAHRQVPLATPQACRLARRYAPARRQRDRRTEARLAREPVAVVRVWAAPCGAVVLSSGPYAPESRHPAYPGRSRKIPGSKLLIAFIGGACRLERVSPKAVQHDFPGGPNPSTPPRTSPKGGTTPTKSLEPPSAVGATKKPSNHRGVSRIRPALSHLCLAC